MRGAQLSGVIRMLLLAAGPALLGLPASAQSVLLAARPANSAALTTVPSGIPPQPSFIPAAPAVSALLRHPIALRTPVGETDLLRTFGQGAPREEGRRTLTYRSIGVGMAGFEEVETPFLDQVRMPLISLGSGRVQLTGFQSVTPMANVVWGLPLRASATGGTVVQQCHPGIRAPRNNQSYGLSLRLRFTKQDTNRAGNGLWRAARQAASWGNAFLAL